jgi:CO/xanthine dehydrogenase Mo-binding subunit
MSKDIIGKGIKRIKAREKVSGRARFTQDLELQGMLYAKILTSPHAHAEIKNIDIYKA